MAAFQITEKGTYTFYAVDKNGNGAVKIAKFVSESDGPGHFSRILMGEMPEATDDRRRTHEDKTIGKNRAHGE